MKINLAKSAGFCFGVRRAIEIALETAKGKKQLFMLGEIVHNEEVVRQIQGAGIKKIHKLGKGKGKTLLIRAHGAPLNIFAKASKCGYKIVDATCPMVKEIHRIAKKMENKGYRLIIVGDKKHDEVRGIAGQLRQKAIVVDPAKNMPAQLKRTKKAAIVVQSTQNLQKTLSIVKILRKHIRDLKFFNTICKPTQMKQRDIKRMPLENNVMIILGSRASANTKRLYEIAKSLNKKSYWVRSPQQINPAWFKSAKTAGVTAGASTPDSIIKQAITYLLSISSKTRS